MTEERGQAHCILYTAVGAKPIVPNHIGTYSKLASILYTFTICTQPTHPRRVKSRWSS